MKKLIKRKDGSYSQRGLWDNIRANKGSGKEPTKQMLKQESKIKKEESMNSMYKKGGKASKKPMKKESFMEESKELHFGAPGVNPPMKKKMMGGKYENGGKNGDPIKTTSDSTAYYYNQADINFTKAKKASGNWDFEGQKKYLELAHKANADAQRQANKGKPGFDANGRPIKKASGGFGMGGKKGEGGTYSTEQKNRQSRASFENGGPGDGTTTRKNLLGRTITETRSGLDYDRTVTRKDGSIAKKSGVKTNAFNPETGTSDTDNFYKKKFDRSGNLKSSESTINKYIQEDKNSKGEYDKNSIPYNFSARSNRNGKVTHVNGVKQFNDNPNRLTINEPDSGSTTRQNLKEKARQSRASFKTGGSMFETMLDKLKVKGKKK